MALNALTSNKFASIGFGYFKNLKGQACGQLEKSLSDFLEAEVQKAAD